MLALPLDSDTSNQANLFAGDHIRGTEIPRMRQQRIGGAQRCWQGAQLFKHRRDLFLVVTSLGDCRRRYQHAVRIDHCLSVEGLLKASA